MTNNESMAECDLTHWNYRVVKSSTDGSLSVREVWYSEDTPASIVADPCYPMGETVDELKKDLADMALALDKPVLEEDSFQEDAQNAATAVEF